MGDREDTKRDAWYDANSAECPECGGTMIRTGHQPASRDEPGFEIWECEDRDGCGYERIINNETHTSQDSQVHHN